MSELKAIRSGEIYNIIEYEDCYRTDDLYYPKSEADKVIADLEESHKMEVEQLLIEIAELKKKLTAAQLALRLNEPEALYSNLDTMNRLSHEIDVVARRERHQKYKRCLAMARWCEDETEINHNSAYEASEYLPSREDYFRRREEHYERWRKRWLEIAEKFKPNNSTAQKGKG